MSNPAMNEDMDIPEKPGPLAEARKSYVQFHLLASLEDEQLLDLLVMTSAALILIMNASRNHVPPVIRGGLEKTIGATERAFTGLREAVRACSTFARWVMRSGRRLNGMSLKCSHRSGIEWATAIADEAPNT